MRTQGKVSRRRWPYPYQAVLAICSDLDETPDRHVYWEIMRFLNTTETTAMGPGVGLEVGNSIYFDMPPDQFSYWNTDDGGRAMVRDLIRGGHIDCLHSYGGLASTRNHALRALDELARHGCQLEVWVDHGQVPTNFGADIMQGHGDERGHEAYHADLTVAHGIRYVWRGRVTSVIGQDVPPSLRGLWTPRHPMASAQTFTKEAAKHALALAGGAKYAMHGPNEVLRSTWLRDESPVYEFLRCNPHWGGVSSCETAKGISEVLTHGFLDRLVQREGACILYTHLGKVRDPHLPFDGAAVAAFRRLAEAEREGAVLVTTTRRVLGYCRAVRELLFVTSRENQSVRIELMTEPRLRTIGRNLSVSDLAGLTFYVTDPETAHITFNGREIPGTLRHGPDHTGRPSISVPWPQLAWPDL